jgi:hypothetical protein
VLPFYADGADLSQYISAAISEFEDARAWHWDHQENPRLLHAADITGRHFVAAAFQLTDPTSDSSPDAISWEDYKGVAENDLIRDEVAEAIQILLVAELHDDLSAMASRCQELAGHVFATRPGPPVLGFIQRLARCYIAGFHPECVMLCRAVLENAIHELYRGKDIPLPATPEGASTMKQRLASAEKLGLLSSRARKDAGVIWTRGNKAIHYDAEATSDVLGTILLTTGVLAEIYGRA